MQMTPMKLREILSKASKSVTTSEGRVDAGSSARSSIILHNDPTSADYVLIEVLASGVSSMSGVYLASLQPGDTWPIDLTSEKNVTIYAKCPSATATLYVTEFA